MKITLLVADEVRPEASGKQTVLGLFADSVVVLKVPPRPSDIPADTPAAIERLSFLVNVSKLPEGHYAFRGQFVAPSGSPMGEAISLGDAQLVPGKSHTVVIESKPFFVKENGGEYTLVFWVNDNEQRLPFEIRVEPQ